jgi:hypothetical protein
MRKTTSAAITAAALILAGIAAWLPPTVRYKQTFYRN